MSTKENIRVVCRLRPENKLEKEGGHKICLSNSISNVKIHIESDKRSGEEGVYEFTFDRIFGPDSKQSEVFDYSAKPIIQSVMDGYNGTLLCYGQTSSGKTFTMEGITSDSDLKGIIPRMIDSVFDYINTSHEDIEFSVKSSFIEIYNEKIQDLLDPRKTNLLIKEEKEKGIWVQDCTEIFVGSSEEINEVFKIGANNRSIAATCMNERSSRSHSIFIITVFQRNNKTESTKTGKLFLVDLAGSEKQKKTKATGNELEEAKNINKSLLNLGIVINSLSEGKNNYIPYRDSKLTRILQDSLGGNSLTTLIATCSMSSFNDKETLSTLRFAYRAKSIKNKPIVNTERSAKELSSKLNSAEEKIKNFENVIQELQNQIENINRGGMKFSTSSSNVNTTNSSCLSSNRCEDCGNAMVKILNQHIEIVGLADELEKIRVEKNELDQEIKLRNEEIYELNEKILLIDLQQKLLLEEEIKNYKEMQTKCENAFIINQKKIIEINNLRNIIEKMRFEVSLVMKSNHLRHNKQTKDYDDFSELENEKMHKIKLSLEEINGLLLKLDNYIYVNSCLLSETNELLCKKNVNIFNEPLAMNNSHLNNEQSNSSSLIKNNISDLINRSVLEHEFKRLNNQNEHNQINSSNKRMKKAKSYSYFIKVQEKKTKLNLDKSIKNIPQPEPEPTIEPSPKKDLNVRMKLDLSKLSMDEVKNNGTDILTSQRKTMLELSLQFKQLQESFSSQQKELKEKDKIISSSNEKTQILIDEYEEKMKKLESIITSKEKEFIDYKDKTLKDFSYKENQILELHNKVAFLEDEKFRLLHLDKDKKKFYAMELQINQLTNEMQKLCKENLKFKQLMEKKEEELKNLTEKLSHLEKKLIETSKTKVKTVDLTSFSNVSLGKNSESGTQTPVVKPASSTLQFQTLNEILTQKLNNIEKAKDSANNSFHSGHNKNSSPISTLGSTNKIMKIVRGKGSSNQFQIIKFSKENSNICPLSNPNNIKSMTPTNENNIEKVNYFNYHSNNIINTQTNNNGVNGFYSKLLQNPGENKISSEMSNKTLRNDKLSQEMKILDEDFGEEYQSPKKDLNGRKEKQYILPQKIAQNGKVNNIGFLSLFTKFITNK